MNSISHSLTGGSNVAFFMILSEYFMGKNISWDRCLSRFISLLVPFLFWNFIVSFEYDSVPYMHVSEYLCRLVGYQSLFVPDFNPLGVQVSIGQPFSTPTWFLRDLLLCFLATPILIKFRTFLIPFIVLAFCMNWPIVINSINATLSPFVLAEFSLGLYLSRYDIGKVKEFFERNEKSLIQIWLLLTGLFFATGLNNYFFCVQSHTDWSIFQRWSDLGVFKIDWYFIGYTPALLLAGSFFILFMGFLLNKYCNKSGFLTKLSGASFLIFILHYPIFNLTPDWIWKKSFILCIVGIIAVIGVISCFYLLISKYAPRLLPYLANVRNFPKRQS
ncbi:MULTISPECIES: acyltransferase [Akkermansia]|uniref:acyltransferase family protein n=1 Tax=Akkermansia sp. TaxID=1872421 RepID=UPI00290EE883|nr:acyltransferase [Candidatus Akkermansia timonensis]MDU7686696.1 acyltransferase [Bacillota bacterium]